MAPEKVQSPADVEKTESQKAQPDAEPCWKKKADAGFLTNMKDHFDEFVNTSMDQHRICLKKTIRGVGYKLKKTGSVRLYTPSSVEFGFL